MDNGGKQRLPRRLSLYGRLAQSFCLHLLCLCVSAASCCGGGGGGYLATANRGAARGANGKCKTRFIIAGCKPDLRRTWLICLANQSSASQNHRQRRRHHAGTLWLPCSLLAKLWNIADLHKQTVHPAMTYMVSRTSKSQTLSIKFEEDAHRRNLEVLVVARNISGGINHMLACD